MKNNLFKKSMSVFLSVLMLMSCWVWVAPTKAEAASNLPDNTIYYPTTVTFSVTDDLANGGHILVYYYKINDDGSVDTSTSHQYTLISSLKSEGYSAVGNGYSKTANIPGWPHKVTIKVANNTWDTDKLALKTITIGNRAVFNDSYTIQDNQELSFAYDNSQGSWSGSTAWFTPSWAVSSSLGGATLQVPSYGTRTSGSLSATFKDSNYNVTWPQNYVNYSINGVGATLSSTTNSTTVSVTNSALANFTDGTGTKNLTLTASGAGKTSTSTITLKAPKKDILYENLFSLSDWYYSDSSKWNDGNVVTDVDAGTIKITNPTTDSSSEYVTNSSTGTLPSNHYAMNVEGGKTYYFTWKTANASSTEVFFMWKDGSGNNLGYPSASFNGDGTHWAEFTAPADAAKVELRFDNNTDGTTATFSDIAVYEKTHADEVGIKEWSARPVRKAYTYNATSAASAGLDKPARLGYEFEGWTDAHGSAHTATAMTQSKTVYSTWTIIPYDIGYDNLFSVAEWSKTSSTVPSSSANGTITWNTQAGTITAESTANGEVYSTYNGTGDHYRMAVKPGTEYIFETSMNLDKGTKGQMFVFFYDANGNGVTGANNGAVSDAHIGTYLTANGTHNITFTTPANCTQIAIRVGATDVGTKATYSDIGVYEKAVYDEYARNYAVIRIPFNYGDTTELSARPTRDGYAFAGWVDADGNQITSVEGLAASATVYATWAKLLEVKFVNYDGTVLKTEYVASGTAATAPSNPTRTPDDNYEYKFNNTWDKDFSNVTTDLVVTAQYDAVEHSAIKYSVKNEPTCTENGWVVKYCENCNHYWNNGEKFEDTTGEYAGKLGHTCTEVVKDKGDETTHKLKCIRCDYTETEAHNFKLDSDHSASAATCVKPGEIYYICACTRTKTEYGELNPDNHTYDYTTGTPNNDSKTHTVYCTGDATHATVTANCTDADKNCICDICSQELVHVYDKQTKTYLVSAAECEIDAVYYLTCQCGKCGTDTWTDVGSARAHEWENTTKYPNTAANCIDDATYYKECKLCGISSENKTGDTWTDTGSKWGHEFNGAYTSNGDGTHVQACTNAGCNATGNKQTCTYGEWTKDNEATHSHTCIHCSYTPAAENHDWTAWTSTNSTANEAGKQTRECKVCHRTEETTCNYKSVKTDATCTTDAYTTYTCDDCGHGYTVIHADTATGHNFSGAYTYDSDADKHQQACTNKDCTAKGVDGVADAWADCVWSYSNKEAGKHTASCACGNSEEQNCSGGTATCTALAVCQFCNTAYGKKANHSYTGSDKYLFKATEATCIANETYYFYCIGCEQTVDGVGTYEKPDTMKPHDYTCTDEYLYIATQAKCGVDETYYAYCSNPDCKKSSEDANNTFAKAGTALEHSWVNPVDNGNGTHTLSCKNTNTDGWACTETTTLNCAESAISYGYTPSTCTQQGYTTYQCSACGYTWNENYEPALGHNYTEKIYDAAHLKEAANCEHANIYWYDCSRCDKNAKDETDTDKYTTLTYVSGNVRKHKWVEYVDSADLTKYIASAATCTAAAKYYTSCEYEDCKVSSKGTADEATFSYGSALKHDWVKPADDVLADYLATPADCVTDATYYYVCSRAADCGVVSSKGIKVDGETWTDEDSKAGHALTHYEANEATCEVDGNIEYWVCSRCNKNFSDAEGKVEITGSVAVTAPGHDWVKYSAKQATCEEDGHNAYEECSRCQQKKAGYTVYPKKGHDFAGTWTYDAVFGYHSKMCLNDCGTNGLVIDGEQVKFEVKYNADDEAVIVGGEQCDFSGEKQHYVDENGKHCHAIACKCGNRIGEFCADAQPTVVDPTCTSNGYTSHTCDECGFTWTTDVVVTEGHKWSDKATPNGDGTHSVDCSVCGVKKDTVKCSGGTATCKDFAKCEVCGGEYGEKGTHKLEGEWTSNNDATCTENGTEWQNCSVCGEKQTRTEAESALGHDMTAFGYTLPEGWDAADFDETTITEPTCHSEGLEISYCKREGCMNYETNVVPANKDAHIWSDEWTLVGGNCATGVTSVRVCTVEGCGAKDTKIETIDHTWKKVIDVKASCEEAAYTVNECTVCKTVETIKGEPATGHSWENNDAQELVVDKPASCGHEGRGHYVCDVCGDKSESVTIAREGHAWDKNNDSFTDEGFEPARDENGELIENRAYVYVEPEDATCTSSGHFGYYKCLYCSYDQHLDQKWIEESGMYIQPLPHKDDDGNGKCDECKAKLYTGGTSNPDEDNTCDCICHREGWFMQLIYKILRFFWKLFKIGKSCECGFEHY